MDMGGKRFTEREIDTSEPDAPSGFYAARFIGPAGARDLGACQSIYGSAEQGDSGRKNRRPTRFGTMAAECHEADVQHVRGVAATNSRAVAFQLIVGTHVRNGARKGRP